MPEMDGLQATKLLRERGGKLATIPIIAFTANAFEEDLKACRDAGMGSFIAKPVRKRNLVEVILKSYKGEVLVSPSMVPAGLWPPNSDGQTTPRDEASTMKQRVFVGSSGG
jgi:DNA-binding NarL/FixJ family response regulator